MKNFGQPLFLSGWQQPLTIKRPSPAAGQRTAPQDVNKKEALGSPGFFSYSFFFNAKNTPPSFGNGGVFGLCLWFTGFCGNP